MTASLTTEQHLITRVGEECAEVIQRVSKYLTYGREEKQSIEDQYNNEQRLENEIIDLFSTITLACEHGLLPRIALQSDDFQARVEDKKNKIVYFMDYARSL